MENTSIKKIKANKENAKKSTGPVSEDGKKISSQNAIKHGLLSSEVLLHYEEERDLEELSRSLHKELNPSGVTETFLVDKIVANIWRLRRAIEVERNIMEYEWANTIRWATMGGDEVEDMDVIKANKSIIDNYSIEKLQRYEVAIEKSIYKAMHELERLRSDQKTSPIVVDIETLSG